MTEKLYPEAAEEAVLGAMLISQGALDIASDTLTEADFWMAKHGNLFKRMTGMYGQGQHVDTVTAATNTDRDWIVHLADSCPTASGVRQYIDIVVSMSKRRKLLRAARQIEDLANTIEDAEEAATQADIALASATGGAMNDAPQVLDELCSVAYKRIEDSAKGVSKCGVHTTITGLDDLIGGLEPGALFVIAARTSVGKSALLVNILQRVCSEARAALFTLEMTKAEILDRMLCAEARVPLAALRTGSITTDQEQELYHAVPEVAKRRLVIDDTTASMGGIERRVRRLAAREPLAIIAVDYLQLVSAGGGIAPGTAEVTEITRRLKLMAKEHQACVVALSQLNRAPKDAAHDREPQLSDLRQSGSIEQDADVVVFIHNHRDTNPFVKKLIVAKHRAGATGKVEVRWEPAYTWFSSMDE